MVMQAGEDRLVGYGDEVKAGQIACTKSDPASYGAVDRVWCMLWRHGHAAFNEHIINQ